MPKLCVDRARELYWDFKTSRWGIRTELEKYSPVNPSHFLGHIIAVPHWAIKKWSTIGRNRAS